MLLMPLFLIPFVNLQRFSLTLLDRWVSKPALHTPNMLWFEHYSIAIRGEQAKSAGEKPLADSVFEDSIACGGAPGQVAGRTPTPCPLSAPVRPVTSAAPMTDRPVQPDVAEDRCTAR